MVQINKRARFMIAKRLYIWLFVIIAIFAYLDTIQILPFHELADEFDDPRVVWDKYEANTLPAFVTLWFFTLILVGFIYWMFTNDKSEAVAIVLAGFILIMTGAEDVAYFAFSDQEMTECMQWFNDLNHPVAVWSESVLGEECVSPNALLSFSVIGVFVSYFVFRRLLKAKW